MKKIMMGVVSALLVVGGLFTTSCKITPEQAKVIANQTGLYSAVTWIAVENPNTNVIASVKDVLSVISTNINLVKEGETYTQVLFPIAVNIINTKVLPQYRPLCKVGVSSLLGGLDMLFIMHPDWKTKQDVAASIAISFIDGAQIGLGMSEKSEIIIKARDLHKTRAKMIN